MPVLMISLEATIGRAMRRIIILISFGVATKSAPIKIKKVRGIMTRAPIYDATVPANVYDVLPPKIFVKGITATAGGTTATSIKPIQMSSRLISQAPIARVAPPRIR
jgi:hypothetical protein